MAKSVQASSLQSGAGPAQGDESVSRIELDEIGEVHRARLAQSPRRLKYPCSAGQKRFWVQDQLEPANSSLHVAVRWRLEGWTSKPHLEQAFQGIVARHESLRTCFAVVDGEPVQIVEPDVHFHVKTVDLTALPAAESRAEADRLARLEARAPFDLQGPPPLIRATCLRLSEQVSVLLLTAHHIVCDGWSVGIIATELCEIYAALTAGRAPVLAHLPLSYGDYCARQDQSGASRSQVLEEAYWRQKLIPASHFELLPDWPRPPVQTNNGNIQSLLLERRLSEGMKSLGRRHGCTMFTTALATLLTLLHRYTGETVIDIGTQIAGRDSVESEGVVGLFINTLVLRGDLSGDPAFSVLLSRVADTVTESFDQPNMSLEKLIAIVRPKRDRSRNPLYSVNFVVQRSFVKDMDDGGRRLVDLPSVSAGAIYELNVFMVERPQGWRLSCEYNTDLFRPETVVRLLKHFENLMRSVIAQPAAKISSLPLLLEEECRTLLVEWNRTEVAYHPQATVSQLFAAQAAHLPEAIAVVCGDRTMTYRQLDLESDRLAAQLHKRRFAAGRFIAVLVHRSLDLVVALLAVHKAGCAYVPLDPEHPPDRLRQILADANVAGLITDREPDPAWSLDRETIIRLGHESVYVDGLQRNDCSPDVADDALAYLIYTSGSTGQPKGVEVTHRSLTNLLRSMATCPGLTRGDVLLAVTTVSFDIAALELFLPLVSGARVVLATEEQVSDGIQLRRLIKQHGVTVMQATPASWRLVLEAGFQSWAGFKMLIGGEALPRELANRLLEGGGDLWNMYGPTETTIWSSCKKVEAGDGIISVGRPIANTQFYVLDGAGRPAPMGLPGLLHIGGEGVARCYHNRPELTAEKFTVNPFAPGRLYSAGDLARWLPGGELQILGRIDHQIKLRGFRIEPGEIESVLLLNPEVSEAVVILGDNPVGEPALWAYVVLRQGPASDQEALISLLRRSLAQALPGYMRPASISILAAMPQMQNGKLDRRALPKPVQTVAAGEGSLQPFSDVERRLAEIWRSVLGVAVTDRRSNFFELGGHSLLAVRLLTRIQSEFGQRFSLATLFKAPLLAEQARLLERGDSRDYDFRQVVRLQSEGPRQPLVAINNTGIYYTLSKRLGPDRPFITLQLFDPSLPATSLPSTLEEIAAGYVKLIRGVQSDGPYALLGWCVAGALAFEVARQLCAAGDRVSQLVLVDTYVPGYRERLSRFRRLLADYSHRWQLIMLSWSKVRSGQQSFATFLNNRVIIKKLRRTFDSPDVIAEADGVEQEQSSTPKAYDQWLLNYLLEAARRYQPQSYPGKITLFRSADEPSGRFLDFQMGWGEYAAGGTEVFVLDGNHFSIFQDPSVMQMARIISASLDAAAGLRPARPNQ